MIGKKEFDKIEKARSAAAEDGWINIKLLQALDQLGSVSLFQRTTWSRDLNDF